MYVAMRQMMVSVPGKGIVQIAPGDEVPGFTDWPLWNRHVHLSQEIVTLASGGIDVNKMLPATKPAEQRVYQNRPVRVGIGDEATEALRGATPPRTAPIEEPAFESDLGEGEPLVEGHVEQPQHGRPKKKVVTKSVKANELMCESCDKGPFKSAHGLKLHMVKAH